VLLLECGLQNYVKANKLCHFALADVIWIHSCIIQPNKSSGDFQGWGTCFANPFFSS